MTYKLVNTPYVNLAMQPITEAFYPSVDQCLPLQIQDASLLNIRNSILTMAMVLIMVLEINMIRRRRRRRSKKYHTGHIYTLQQGQKINSLTLPFILSVHSQHQGHYMHDTRLQHWLATGKCD